MAGARERQVAQAVAEELRVVMGRKMIRPFTLSKAAGIPKSTMDAIYKGEGAIDVDQLARICRVLGVDPGEVLSAALKRAARTVPPVTYSALVDDERALTAKQKAALKRDIPHDSHEPRNTGGPTGDVDSVNFSSPEWSRKMTTG